MQLQASRGMPPQGSVSLGDSGSSGSVGSDHHRYGFSGMGQAIASEDRAAMAAVADHAFDKQTLYEGPWQEGDTASAATPSRRNAFISSFSRKSDASRSMPSTKELTKGLIALTGALGDMDANDDGEINLQELQHGIQELGVEMPYAELESFLKLADEDHNGKIDADELVAAVRSKAAMSFEQEAAEMINSIIAREIQEYDTLAPKWAAFMMKLQHEGVDNREASDVVLDLYKRCEPFAGLHDQCVLERLEPLIGSVGEQALEDGQTFSSSFVQMVFIELERQLQVYLQTFEEEE